MEQLDRKSLAQFRLLVAVAKADGKLEETEIGALKGALGRHSGVLDQLLGEAVDVDAELGQLDDKERRRLYQSAFALTYADGHAAVDEVNLLKRLVPDEGEKTMLGQVFGETLDTLVPGRIVAVADPAQREMEILEDIIKYSVLSAVAGAMPIPGVGVVADLAVVALQAKMIHDIGQYWGHHMDMPAIRAFIGGVAGSTGVRIAVNNLARFVPGWGSAFGAATSFATTFALGQVAQKYFAAGRELDASELKGLYEAAKVEGRSAYEKRQDEIAEAKKEHGEKLKVLAEQLADGQISRAEYDAAVAALG